jgi:drug/metabolite transporter (DMT)-like permease
MKGKLWLVFALFTTIAWGFWGALIDTPAQAGFPETLGYCVWSLTMIPPSLIALRVIRFKLDRNFRAVLMGCAVGFLGAGGQLILFRTLRTAPAYLVFPFIALSPVVTILMSYAILKERATYRGWIGIFLALAAGVLLSMEQNQQQGSGYTWIILSSLVFIFWGVQGYIIKFANRTMKAESIFFYMMLTGLLLAPIALAMTDFSQKINWGFKGPYLAAMIQILNAVGALFLVYSFRYGKAIIISPLTNAGAPMLTVIISLIISGVLPPNIKVAGMVLALTAAFLMAIEPEEETG